MSSPIAQLAVSIFVSLLMTTGATAAEPSAVSHRCASVVDPVERLACYDAAFPRVANGHVDAESQRVKAVDEFGLSRTQLREREPESVQRVLPDRVEAKVAGVVYRPTGERVITLDSGQVWLLTEATSKGYLRVGDPVVIKNAALATFLLITPNRVPLRARRIK